MKDVALISIAHGKPKTHIVMEFSVDGQLQTCSLIQVPGETSFEFDESFDRLFGTSMIARQVGKIARNFIRGQSVMLPVHLNEHPIAH